MSESFLLAYGNAYIVPKYLLYLGCSEIMKEKQKEAVISHSKKAEWHGDIDLVDPSKPVSTCVYLLPFVYYVLILIIT